MIVLDDKGETDNLIDTVNDSGRLRLGFLSFNSIKLFHKRKGVGNQNYSIVLAALGSKRHAWMLKW